MFASWRAVYSRALILNSLTFISSWMADRRKEKILQTMEVWNKPSKWVSESCILVLNGTYAAIFFSHFTLQAYRTWVSEQGHEEPPMPGIKLNHNQIFFLNFAQVSFCSMADDLKIIMAHSHWTIIWKFNLDRFGVAPLVQRATYKLSDQEGTVLVDSGKTLKRK